MFWRMNGLAGSLRGEIGYKQADWIWLIALGIDTRKDISGPEDIERFLVNLLVASHPSCNVKRHLRQRLAGGISINSGSQIQQKPGCSQQQNHCQETKVLHVCRLFAGNRHIMR